MAPLEYIKLAFRSIGSNRLRTVLTVLIIAIGISALVGIQTSLQNLASVLESEFAIMGANSFTIQNESFSTSGGMERTGPNLTYAQVKRFKSGYDFESAKVSAWIQVSFTSKVQYQGEETNPNVSVFGVDEEYLPLSGYELRLGRNFSAMEAGAGDLLAIIGADVAKKLFDKSEGLGKSILLEGKRFQIVGILESRGSSMVSSDNVVFLPLGTARSYLLGGSPAYRMSVSVGDADEVDLAVDEATAFFRTVRKIRPGQSQDFDILRSDGIAAVLVDMLGSIGIGGTVIGLFTIIGAAIGLMNILLVSVRERTREIGISMALGAPRKLIMRQFLTESVMICVMGGISGTILGLAFGLPLAVFMDATFQMPWLWIFLGLLITVIVGLAAGIYPAIKASRLDPIEALRYE
jgi:putative ABC transport system permease protein